VPVAQPTASPMAMRSASPLIVPDTCRCRKADSDRVGVAPNTRCRISHPIASLAVNHPSHATIALEKITIQPGAKAAWVLAIDRNGYAGVGPPSWREAERLRKEAAAYWEKSAALQWDCYSQRFSPEAVMSAFRTHLIDRAVANGPGDSGDFSLPLADRMAVLAHRASIRGIKLSRSWARYFS